MDGVEVFSGDVAVGDVVPLEFDVSGATRITLETVKLEGAKGAVVVLVGDLDGSESVIVATPPASGAVEVGSLGLVDTALYCDVLASAVVLGASYQDVWGCDSGQYGRDTWVEFNLAAQYGSFSGFVSVTDVSPSATTTRATVSVDGVEVFSGDVAVGDVVPLEFDVSGATRITLETVKLEGAKGAVVVLVGDTAP
ncbi:MAG: hypothetical protein DHS20C19_17520 [Acidimicrobiales bacterium]|nr:MAG: hypothetical protein DHS20C19_17520 [Acidimicrobiales bacterium]